MKKQQMCDATKNLLKIQKNPTKQQVISKKGKQLGSDQMVVPISLMQRAEAVQESLNPVFPSFVKPMVRSNVTTGFWLYLPKLFHHHMPRTDTTVILEDEERIQFPTKYIFNKKGLSAGWKGFSDAHNLVEGDVLILHMIKPTKIKVYIIKMDKLNEVDAALSLMHLKAEAK